MEDRFRIFAGLMNGPVYISVILPLKLEWEPCYMIEDKSDVCVGDRVQVMFSGRKYSGVISAVDITPETEISKIRKIICVEQDMQRILEEEILFWRKISEYYLCTVGEVYKAAYPAGKINLEEARAGAISKARERREKLIEAMKSRAARLEERLYRKNELAAKAKEGTKARVRYSEEAAKLKAELEAAEKAIAAAEHDGATQREAKSGSCISAHLHRTVTLSSAQEKAYEDIVKAFDSGKPAMLHGVTGSGKTEIYIRLAQEAIGRGSNVLYLVPEIALSRQLEDRLYGHFGDRLMIFHSGESAASRRNTADALRSHDSEGLIILGTRSSIFLPHRSLGLIIVDEEHDSSYKQDSPAPRYNGRDAALMLSVIHKADIILGSATPSLEEIYNCRAGKHRLIQLRERYHNSEDSDIEIIDTRAERRKRGMRGNFSIRLIRHIEDTLKKGEQVIILRSRRAWSSLLQCNSCGEIVKCPHCNVSLSLHKGSRERMVCHYCGHSAAYTGKCQKCGGELHALGAGTQRIEEEAAALFPEARIARLDSDTTQNRTLEIKIIKDFSKGNTDILIGTQMVTKGFDFSGVSLVAVITADTLLGLQDFRADEKAMQMLEQFRGRCGRRGNKGLLAIQTSQPEHPIYQGIINNDIHDLSSNLLQERMDFNFPPYTRIVEIIIRDTDAERGTRMGMLLSGRIGDATGPYAPAVDKVADNHIRVIRISLKKDRHLPERKATIKKAVASLEKEYRYDGHITINVDPS